MHSLTCTHSFFAIIIITHQAQQHRKHTHKTDKRGVKRLFSKLNSKEARRNGWRFISSFSSIPSEPTNLNFIECIKTAIDFEVVFVCILNEGMLQTVHTKNFLLISIGKKRVWILFARVIYLFNSIKSLFDTAHLSN